MRSFQYSTVPSVDAVHTICGIAFVMVRNRSSLARSARVMRLRSMDSQQRLATPRSSATSNGVHARGTAWCTAMQAANRPSLCSGMQMPAHASIAW